MSQAPSKSSVVGAISRLANTPSRRSTVERPPPDNRDRRTAAAATAVRLPSGGSTLAKAAGQGTAEAAVTRGPG